MENLIYRGKVKDVYDLNDKLKFKFSNRISVFDQIIPNEIKCKGEVLCRIAKFWFEKIEKENICKTHFINIKNINIKNDEIKNDEMIVKKANVIPLEFITRYYNAGSYYKRNKGKYGEKFHEPIFEITTKFEKYDRIVNEEEALKISKLKKEDLDKIKEICIKVDKLIQREVEKRDLIHVDGKKEFGIYNDEIILIDTFGTPDEDRFWSKKEYQKGNFNELSKEFVRKYYENLFFICPKCNEKFSYKDFLYAQREAKLQEPLIPPLPKEKVSEIENLYKTMYEKITGLKF